MQLRAVSVGSAVPQDNFDATIQSIFDSSVNLRLEQEDRMITVLVSDHYDLPQGIRLGEKISLHSLTVGLRAASRGGILRFGSSLLTIDLRGASIWNGKLATIMPPTKGTWSMMWRELNEQQRFKGTELVAEELFRPHQGSLLTQKLSQPVLQLIVATGKFDPHACEDALRGMIGLGPGVTPSGDDILVGFLAGLHSTAGDEYERQSFIRLFGNAILLLSKGTNEISRTYLYHAIQGEFSSSIVTLIDTLLDGNEEQILLAVRNVILVGHSSGMDSITGFLMGLAAWAPSSFYFDYKETNLWQLHNA